MTVVNESGLYNVILRSDKPEAKPFRKWVTAEVSQTHFIDSLGRGQALIYEEEFYERITDFQLQRGFSKNRTD